MKKQRRKYFSGPFVGLTKSIMETPAWHAMSYGARSLYTAYRGTLRNDCGNNGKSYLSCRDAAKALGTKSTRSIVRWYAELEHYGFIRKTSPGFLGSDGRGIAARYRITEYAHGTHEPTRDFARWNGEPFVYTPRRPARKQNPVSQRGTPRAPKGHIRKGSGNGSVCVPKGHIESTPKCVPKGHTSRIARGSADPNRGQGSSRARAPAQTGDAGSNPAPEAMATSRGR